MSAVSSPPCRILILGGGYAGLTVAQRLSKLTDIAITLIGAKADFQYRIRLHQVAAGQSLPIHADSRILSPLGVKFLQARVIQQGQIVTDAALRSRSHPNIIAIGDAAQAHSEEAGTCRMGCATGLALATAGARTPRALLAGQEPPAFRFVYLFRNVSLGRHDGLIQFVDRRDRPRNLVWTGSAAAVWKEYVCRSTLATTGIAIPQRPPAIPPLRTLLQLWPRRCNRRRPKC